MTDTHADSFERQKAYKQDAHEQTDTRAERENKEIQGRDTEEEGHANIHSQREMHTERHRKTHRYRERQRVRDRK